MFKPAGRARRQLQRIGSVTSILFEIKFQALSEIFVISILFEIKFEVLSEIFKFAHKLNSAKNRCGELTIWIGFRFPYLGSRPTFKQNKE